MIIQQSRVYSTIKMPLKSNILFEMIPVFHVQWPGVMISRIYFSELIFLYKHLSGVTILNLFTIKFYKDSNCP